MMTAEKVLPKSRAQEVTSDVAALLRARSPLLWVVSKEEARVEGFLFEAAASAGYVARTWDVAQGFKNIAGESENDIPANNELIDALAFIRARASGTYGKQERGIWILRDAPVWITPPLGSTPMRAMRNLARYLPSVAREKAQAIVILSPNANVPDELSNHVTVIEFPLPDRAEISDILYTALNSLPEELKAKAAPNGAAELAIDSAMGLSAEEAAACYAKSLVQARRIDPVTVANEKKRVIARERVMEWYDPIPGGLESVGGLDLLKSWLLSRASAYSPKARAYGLPAPKGCMLVGISGCGKSLTAKAIATAWKVPLIRLDMGALKSKFVGESEANLRKAFRTIEAIGRCVVWIDEVEKALGGATQGAADGGVSADALGGLLTWMQERKGESFVIMTANDITQLPPEFIRKGRFDEVWWVDLPTTAERAEVLAASLRQHKRGDLGIQCVEVAMKTEGFNGAEIAALVPDAMYAAFGDGEREITTKDLLEAAKNVVPLSATAKDKITEMRAWAKGKARRATSEETVVAPAKGRQLDF